VLTHSLVANNTDKYSMGSGSTAVGNSNSFCLNKAAGAAYQQQHNENQTQHSSRATSSSHNMSYQQPGMGGSHQLAEMENRPPTAMNSFLHGHGSSSTASLP
jgi:hypothetical protein